ncbi:hypothetical protein QTO34_017063 [Cnephaeus nilssonii]|uniref:Cytochrome b-c1 complex subunit 7 n=1 Tax=Cnephaeus nilssonii TaxID=3371016 RepID=A0AA40I0B4_CNENI|nr:hypothetical protein QTO34_017063 [Eptesicus nilssonii]
MGAGEAVASASSRWLEGIRKWYYSASGFNEVGLMRDNTIHANKHVEEAIRRLPENLYHDRVLRIKRALDLSMRQQILPKEQWIKYEEDKFYLEPYLKESLPEMQASLRWRLPSHPGLTQGPASLGEWLPSRPGLPEAQDSDGQPFELGVSNFAKKLSITRVVCHFEEKTLFRKCFILGMRHASAARVIRNGYAYQLESRKAWLQSQQDHQVESTVHASNADKAHGYTDKFQNAYKTIGRRHHPGLYSHARRDLLPRLRSHNHQDPSHPSHGLCEFRSTLPSGRPNTLFSPGHLNHTSTNSASRPPPSKEQQPCKKPVPRPSSMPPSEEHQPHMACPHPRSSSQAHSPPPSQNQQPRKAARSEDQQPHKQPALSKEPQAHTAPV